MNYTKQELLDYIDEELEILNEAIRNYDGRETGLYMKRMMTREQKLREIRAYVSLWEPKA